MPVLMLFLMVLAVVVLNLPSGGFLRRIAFGVALALFLLEILLSIWPSIAAGVSWPASAFNLNPISDGLSLLLTLSVGIVGLAALVMAHGAVPEDEGRRFNFINLLLLVSAGMNGIVAVSDIFTLYIFIELTATASLILIIFNKERDSFEGAFKYFLLSAVATTLILAGIGLLMMQAGGTSFDDVRRALAEAGGQRLALVGVMLFLGGLFIKSGLVPFHGWLPDAYSSAPNPVSVLLAGIVTKATGVYALVRLTTAVFAVSRPLTNVLLFVGILTILAGALAALGQRDFKRMLAYSSISQMGYIVMGIGAGNPLGVAGAVFHIFNHSIFKSLLFVNAAAVEASTGTRDMDRLGGLSSRMRTTGITSLVGFLSAAGIPPLAGFWSKLLIIIGLFQAGRPYYGALAILGSLITLAYLLVMQRRIFFGELRAGLEGAREAGGWIAAPSVILAAITIGVGVFFPYLVNSILVPIRVFGW